MKLREKTMATLLIAIFMISIFAVLIPVSADFELYSFTGTAGGVKNDPVEITVVDDGTHITWTIDFPGVAPYDGGVEGNGQWTVGLVIALDGVEPAFQIHNNDGSTLVEPHGTWMYGYWGPTIDDGWFGWPNHDLDVSIADFDWVTCSGEWKNADNPDGIFTISIDKSELGYDFHWALNLAIGTGFYGTYMTYEQMSCPVGEYDYFDWANPLVDNEIPNYEYAQLVEFRSDFVPGIGKGLDKGIPNDNFAKGRQE